MCDIYLGMRATGKWLKRNSRSILYSFGKPVTSLVDKNFTCPNWQALNPSACIWLAD